MALTATAQSAFREPAWDEVIVPTLRKRLQDESSVLAKRMSAASMGSADDHDPYQPATPSAPYSSNYRPSAIPRPSLQQSRTEAFNGSARPPQPSRSRTYSQPYTVDSPNPNRADAQGFPAGSSRPTSPMVNGKVTRIPVSRGRAGSTSSYAQSSIHGSIGKTEGGSNGINKHYIESADSADLYPLDETQRSYNTRSTIRLPKRKTSDLFNESAPFNSSPGASTQYELDYDSVARRSSESEERPFEHWYRGDVSRNGGVGELRVGRRDEMLDIANYGHTFRKASSRIALDTYNRSRSNSRGRDTMSSHYGTRKRAESIDAPIRESLYLDENDPGADMVMDEQPPTDFEDESFEDHHLEAQQTYEQEVLPHSNGTVSTPTLTLQTSQNGHMDASRPRPSFTGASRIPTPTFQRTSPPPRTPTPTKLTRGASDATTATTTSSSTPTTPRSQRLPRSPSQPQPQQQQPPPQATGPRPPATAATTTAKQWGKSSAAGPPAKKARNNSKPPSSMQKRAPRTEENRRSIGQYPTPDGDDVVDAIPSWTQPVPPSGNWDDVVLPVVARKKGLEGQYATADGSPRPPQKTASQIYEPAPGTFGFDHTKVRRRPEGEAIPMDEFGQKMDMDDVRDGPPLIIEQPKPQPSLVAEAPADPIDRARSLPSPPPFAHYAVPENKPPAIEQKSLGAQFAAPPPMMNGHDQGPPEEEGSAGCCKCIIM